MLDDFNHLASSMGNSQGNDPNIRQQQMNNNSGSNLGSNQNFNTNNQQQQNNNNEWGMDINSIQNFNKPQQQPQQVQVQQPQQIQVQQPQQQNNNWGNDFSIPDPGQRNQQQSSNNDFMNFGNTSILFLFNKKRSNQ